METRNNYCSFNRMIDCTVQTGCPNCGWNPDVARKRAEQVKRSLGVQTAAKGKSVPKAARA